ncbi:hypothetical protein I4U23_014242 [Adineta vaga]|nr:hypothetical protein I4U23_014242 [Adineta vaga]
MFLHLFTVFAIFHSSTSKPTILKNISDCRISVDGVLQYFGQHSKTKFGNDCLTWSDLQTVFPGIVNEPNFLNDTLIKNAQNYCRNPNGKADGPWCYVQYDDAFDQESCGICQSLIPKPTLPLQIEDYTEVTTATAPNNFFENIRDELKRVGAIIRDKFLEIIERIKTKFRQYG